MYCPLFKDSCLEFKCQWYIFDKLEDGVEEYLCAITFLGLKARMELHASN